MIVATRVIFAQLALVPVRQISRFTSCLDTTTTAKFCRVLANIKKDKACLYVNKLADIDIDVLEELIRAGLRDLDAKWPVTA